MADDQQTSNAIELFKHCRSEIQLENDLLNKRLGALLSSQSFLVIAYGTSMSSANGQWHSLYAIVVPPLLALLGLTLAILARPGIHAAQAVLHLWHCREAELLARSPEVEPYTLLLDDAGRREVLHRRREGALFAARAPVVLVVAWCVLASLPLLFRVFGV